MRNAASLAYLLARTSDTLTDTHAASTAMRIACLDPFRQAIAGAAPPPRWPDTLLAAVPDPLERRLLLETRELFSWLDSLPPTEAHLVRDVVTTIISGQQFDLERFTQATPTHPVALADDAELDDYTWRVAGCVGGFWTQLGILTLGERFSHAPSAWLLERGIAYGKSLQLVNILRDLPRDLATGRCYLPVANPLDSSALLASHAAWLERAQASLANGFAYASTLRTRRLQAATVLPAMLAEKTLNLLRGASWTYLQTRIKIPRSQVYLALARAITGWK